MSVLLSRAAETAASFHTNDVDLNNKVQTC